MKGRRKTKRRRTSGAMIGEAEFERRMNRILADVRRGLFGGNTFEEAVADLRRQLVMRGGDGVLHDVQCFLAEDGKTATLFANWHDDQTVCANFALPAPTTEDRFNAQHYIEEAEG